MRKKEREKRKCLFFFAKIWCNYPLSKNDAGEKNSFFYRVVHFLCTNEAKSLCIWNEQVGLTQSLSQVGVFNNHHKKLPRFLRRDSIKRVEIFATFRWFAVINNMRNLQAHVVYIRLSRVLSLRKLLKRIPSNCSSQVLRLFRCCSMHEKIHCRSWVGKLRQKIRRRCCFFVASMRKLFMEKKKFFHSFRLSATSVNAIFLHLEFEPRPIYRRAIYSDCEKRKFAAPTKRKSHDWRRRKKTNLRRVVTKKKRR